LKDRHGENAKNGPFGPFLVCYKNYKTEGVRHGQKRARYIYKNFSKVFDRDDVLQSPRRAEKNLHIPRVLFCLFVAALD